MAPQSRPEAEISGIISNRQRRPHDSGRFHVFPFVEKPEGLRFAGEAQPSPLLGRIRVTARALAGPGTALWALNVVMTAIAGAGFIGMVATAGLSPVRPGPVPVVAAVVAILFAVAEIWVVHLHIQRSYQSLSINEIPLVLGLFLLPAPLLILAQVLGAAVALRLHRHQSPGKLVFNLANLTLAASVDVIGFRLLAASPDPANPRTWMAVFISVTLGNSIAIALIVTAMSLSEGRVQVAKVGPLITASLVATVLNGSMGLISVGLAWKAPSMTWLLVVPAAGAVLAFRVFGSERDRNEQMEFLYQSSQLLQQAFRADSALAEVLAHGMAAFRVQVAELTLLSPDASGPATRTTVHSAGESSVERFAAAEDPLLAHVIGSRAPVLVRAATAEHEIAAEMEARGLADGMAMSLHSDDGVIGSILFGNRIGALFFSPGETRLFETYARHLSVSLETGRLALDLQHQAYHDSLTGLANRAQLARRLAERLSAPDGPPPAVLILDLDDFKLVNDGLGHAAGDKLLVSVAERLAAAVGQDDIVARLGGDEFAVMLGSGTAGADAADWLAAALIRPFVIEGNTVNVNASIGIADPPDQPASPDDLLRRADVAMYKAKAAGKATAKKFESAMQDEFETRHRLKSELERAIAEREFVLMYQPIVRLATGRIYGAEALVRWRHPSGSLIGPSEFIPLAEEVGLIREIGAYVLATAAESAARWQRRFGDAAPMVSINISGRQLEDPRFVTRFAALIRRLGVRPQGLVLEITETVMLQESVHRRDPLAELKALGVLLSVDDFGTGYSSLSQLSQMPIDVLKIAKPFIDKLEAGGSGSAFAEAIIALGRTLKLRVVAEGVETSRQLERLWDLRCELGQGYYFSHPVGAEEFEQLVSRDCGERGLPQSTLKVV